MKDIQNYFSNTMQFKLLKVPQYEGMKCYKSNDYILSSHTLLQNLYYLTWVTFNYLTLIQKKNIK